MPSKSLEGLTTTSGWKVTKHLNYKLGTGGNFCSRYLVESEEGEIGFLKAMDLSSSIGDLQQLQQKVTEYLFEQDILNKCKDMRLSKVVTPLDAGEIIAPNFQPPLNKVYYVIFEKADGTLRERHLEMPNSNWLPAFIALHHVAIGIEQLHSAGIAHQDIKPSNVLAFSDDLFKVSDLGRVVDKEEKSPFRHTYFPGDHTYKPTEMSFGMCDLRFSVRRSCDMYMVGSLVYHLVEGIPINMSVINEACLLDARVRHKSHNDALPFLLAGFNTILRRYKEHCSDLFGSKIGRLLKDIVYEMCYPDPLRRGAPKLCGASNQYSMRRYVGKLGNMVRLAKIHGVK